MDSLVVPDIDMLRRWLDQQNITVRMRCLPGFASAAYAEF